MHKAKHKLGEFLNDEAKESLDGVDLILWLVDASTPPTEEDLNISLPARKHFASDSAGACPQQNGPGQTRRRIRAREMSMPNWMEMPP
jgi:hypothetical protein